MFVLLNFKKVNALNPFVSGIKNTFSTTFWKLVPQSKNIELPFLEYDLTKILKIFSRNQSVDEEASLVSSLISGPVVPAVLLLGVSILVAELLF